MTDERRDRELGLERGIPRRDFLNGIALGTASLWLSPAEILAQTVEGARYPPGLISASWPAFRYWRNRAMP